MLNLSGKNILVVEDEEMNFIYLKQIFKFSHGNITRVMTGQSAIDSCKEQDYDLIMMDIQLPDMSGMQAVKLIREFNTKILIIAQTACRTPDEIDNIIESGCNDVLVKPFKIEDFNAVLEKYI